jgi:bacillithiol biosynthesis cysteine-adding enzyme BshC
MQKNISLETVGGFSPLFIDYLAQKESLKSFYTGYPVIENFKDVIENKSFSQEKRQILVQSLQKQYQGLENQPNIEQLLEPNTFTVTTGHQLNIFTGPLYIIYKIVTIINLAKSLKKAYPAYNFVPIYWLASEDHDFAEIASFNLFGKKYVWETNQTGAVGRMNPKELEKILLELPEKSTLFEQSYLQSTTLANAVRIYMHQLFGAEGLISIDADDRDLKSIFAETIKDDVLNQSAFEVATKTTQKLTDLGYRTQIYPREINFFYLDNGLRERIVQEGEKFKVLNTTLSFSADEISHLIQNEPEKFSPNVVLRPLYQESILPNLAYIGGPSEVPYWLQLKEMFEHYKEQFPILIPRNFALIVNQANQKRMEKLGISVEELFLDEINLKRTFIEKNTENSLSLEEEKSLFQDVFKKITAKSVLIDKTLEAPVQVEQTKLLNALENLEKRLKKAEERNQETGVNQVLGLKNKLFPNGSLQERAENFLNFQLNNPVFIKQLLDTFEPLQFDMNVVEV